MQNLRSNVEECVTILTEQLKEEKAGSEESKIIADNIQKLYKACIEDVKSEVEIMNSDAQRQEMYARVNEINARLNKQDKWYELIKPDTIISCGTVIVLWGLSIHVEKSGHILPNALIKVVDKIKVCRF